MIKFTYYFLTQIVLNLFLKYQVSTYLEQEINTIWHVIWKQLKFYGMVCYSLNSKGIQTWVLSDLSHLLDVTWVNYSTSMSLNFVSAKGG